MRIRGFSMVELMVVVALSVILMSVAVPSFQTWIRNAQIRATAESVQSGARVAQAEALRLYQQVVLFRTDEANCSAAATAAAAGKYWAVRTVPIAGGPAARTVQCGTVADAGSGITVNGPTALCFSAAGRLMAHAAPGVGAGAACVLAAAGTSSYDILGGTSAGTRPLRVIVALGGSVRMCDPAKVYGADTPEGCPS